MTLPLVDVIAALNTLSLPHIPCLAPPHDPTDVTPSIDSNVPTAFTQSTDLIANLLVGPLQAYLSDSCSPDIFEEHGRVGALIEHAREAVQFISVESELQLRGILGLVIGAVNAIIWEDVPRNANIRARNMGFVGVGNTGKPDFDLRRGLQRLVGIEIKPENVVSLDVMRTISLLSAGQVFYNSMTYVVEIGAGSLFQHISRNRDVVKALTVLRQIWSQFPPQSDQPPLRFVVLTNHEATLLFARTPTSIVSSAILYRDGRNTATDPCQNLITLLLALAVLPDADYAIVPVRPSPRQTRATPVPVSRATSGAGDAGVPLAGGSSSASAGPPMAAALACSDSTLPPVSAIVSQWSSPEGVEAHSPRSATGLVLANVGTERLSLDIRCLDVELKLDFCGAIYPSHLNLIVFRGPASPTLFNSGTAPKLDVTAVTHPLMQPEPTMSVTERVGQGAIWNVFKVSNPASGGSPQVLKVTGVQSNTEHNYSPDDVRRCVANEIMVLKKLEDIDHTPRLVEVWAGGNPQGCEYWALLVEDAGNPLLSVDELTARQKDQIVETYDAIHHHDILHGDIKDEHWHVQPDGRVMVIDYTHALDLSGVPDCPDKRSAYTNEAATVRGLLRLPRGV